MIESQNMLEPVQPDMDTEDDRDYEDAKRNPVEWLMQAVKQDNVAELLSEEELDEIGSRVKRDYDIDKSSRSEWEEKSHIAMKLAKQVKEEKSYPWPGAANVKYPLLTTAAIQFNARCYPEIIQGKEVVKARVVGEDPENTKEDRAKRVSLHMSYQCTEEMPEWEEGTDRLTLILPIIGCCFRKTFFDSSLGRPFAELVLPDDLVVNNKAKSIDTARRITHRYDLYENDIYEAKASGVWLDVELGLAPNEESPGDNDSPHEFLEQHRFIDLDEDGYAEPYIVTVHSKTSRVVRIAARFSPENVLIGTDRKTGEDKIAKITPDHYFTKYSFLPDPEGGFYDLGFGQLLEPINESINTTLNQLHDAGTLANLQGGWIRGLKIKKGQHAFQPGEWKSAPQGVGDLRADVLPLPYKEPSTVLFQLLGFLVEAGKEISSVKDIMTGGNELGANVPATTVLSMVEQGMKVFSATCKRIYRSLTSEYRKLFKLNAKYLDPQQIFRVLDVPYEIFQGDYNVEDLDIAPVADPQMSTDVQRLARARALQELTGRVGINEYEVTRRLVEAIRVPNQDAVIIPEDQLPAPPPDPRAIEIQAKIEMDGARLQMEMVKFNLDIERMIADIENVKAKTILAIAQAEAAEVGPQLEQYKQQMALISMDIKQKADIVKGMVNAASRQQPNSGGVRGVEAQPDNQGSLSAPEGAEAALLGAIGGGGMPQGIGGPVGNGILPPGGGDPGLGFAA